MANCGIIFLTCCCCLFLISSAQPPAFLAIGGSFTVNVSSGEHIIQTQSNKPTFACGFYRNQTYYFSVFIYADESSSSDLKVVWIANRDKPLSDGSILRLSQDGNLELVDGHGRVIWFAGAAGKPVAAMKLEESGNLVLLDAKNVTVWQSFDHPTDTLVARQQLQNEQKLTSSSSTEASYFVSTKDGDLSAFVDGKPPLMYLQLKDFSKIVIRCNNTDKSPKNNCKGSEILFFITFSPYGNAPKTVKKSVNHFIKLESDGRLNVYDWNTDENIWLSSEFGNPQSDECLYPLRCGPFGVCKDGQCSCPAPPDRKTQYFKPLYSELPNHGCEEISPAPSCNEHDAGSLVYFGNYSYFAYVDPSAAVAGNITTLDACCEACSNNCACKAVFFSSQNDSTSSNCYLFDEVLSIRAEPLYRQTYTSRAFFKVSALSISPPQAPSESQGQVEQDRKRKNVKLILGIAVGLLAVAAFLAGTIVFLVRRKMGEEEDEEEDELDQVPGMMPRRFSYEELKTATRDFQMILGQGGFGSVFRGILNDGIQVAVKRLDNRGQGTKEFVAGSNHWQHPPHESGKAGWFLCQEITQAPGL